MKRNSDLGSEISIPDPQHCKISERSSSVAVDLFGQDTELGELGSRCSLTGSVQAAVFRGLKPDITYTMKVSLKIRQSSQPVLFLHSHHCGLPWEPSVIFIVFSLRASC
jgi:hypothetical protein